MNARKYLIAGVVFLAIQVISMIINGFSKFSSGSYGVGYLFGYFAPAIIGVIFLVLYFIKRNG